MNEINEITVPSPTELEPTPPDVKRYQRLKLRAGICSLILSLAALTFMALAGGPYLDRFVKEKAFAYASGSEEWTWVAGNNWLRLAVLGFLYAAGMEVLTLPLDFWSGFILEHRYQLSNQTFLRWIWRRIKSYLVGGPLGLLFLYGLYALLWYGGPFWWLWAALAWLAASIVLGQLLPIVILPLFYKVTRIEDAALLDRLRRISAGTGIKVEGVYRLGLSAETKKANAALTGLGRTRRVLLGDTLLQEFTPEEIDVVFAHEVGHHVHRHLRKLIAWSVVLAIAGLYLADVVLRSVATALDYPNQPLPAYQDPAALPLLLLVLMLFGLFLAPLRNAVSRFFEKQCDRYALDRTRLPDAYRSAFVKLCA